MNFIFGKKLGMSQIFAEDGTVTPVTVVGVEPNVVLQVKTKDTDGYDAVKLGTGKRGNAAKEKRSSFVFVREVRLSEPADFQAGQQVNVNFEVGDTVRVSGVTKGKGFAGPMKRHGFHGMPASHGHAHVARHRGSIGQRFPQHTLRGTKMAGHMGNRNLTVRGIKVISIDNEGGILTLRGALPGNKGGWLKILTQ